MKKLSQPGTKEILDLLRELLVPAAMIERTVKLPPDVTRYENVVEHSYFLATLGCALAQRVDPGLDLGKVSQYALVHDLVEVYAGDTKVFGPAEELASKAAREAAALGQVEQRFGRAFPWIDQTIRSYERLNDPESCFVYALDKILPHAIIAVADHHPVQPTWEKYKWSETVAREKIGRYPKLLPYFEDLCRLFAVSPHYFVDGLEAMERDNTRPAA